MPTFKNLKQAYDFTKKGTKDAFHNLAKEVYGVIQLYVQDRQYNWNPKEYVATLEYLNSLTVSEIVSNGNGYNVEIYFDTDKIHPYILGDGKWNQHADFWGNPVNDQLPLWLEEGTPNNPYYQHPGNHAVSDTLDEFKNGKAMNDLKIFLEKRGFKCKIK